tara:strand:+ start:99 stop:467 length:369 start_codon:yes stop_codon:yes gene_type:complete
MIGKNIRKLRELKEFSQGVLSKGIGISQKQLSRIESGDASPSYDNLVAISDFLDISLQQLLNFDENIIFNNNPTHQQGGEYIAYNNTEIKFVTELYERLLLEKDKIIHKLEIETKALKENLK